MIVMMGRQPDSDTDTDSQTDPWSRYSLSVKAVVRLGSFLDTPCDTGCSGAALPSWLSGSSRGRWGDKHQQQELEPHEAVREPVVGGCGGTSLVCVCISW